MEATNQEAKKEYTPNVFISGNTNEKGEVTDLGITLIHGSIYKDAEKQEKKDKIARHWKPLQGDDIAQGEKLFKAMTTAPSQEAKSEASKQLKAFALEICNKPEYFQEVNKQYAQLHFVLKNVEPRPEIFGILHSEPKTYKDKEGKEVENKLAGKYTLTVLKGVGEAGKDGKYPKYERVTKVIANPAQINYYFSLQSKSKEGKLMPNDESRSFINKVASNIANAVEKKQAKAAEKTQEVQETKSQGRKR